MAKIAFVQFLFMQLLGPMQLSAQLKKAGHKCIMAAGNPKEILNRLNRERPDMIAFSSTANERRWVKYMARRIKDNFSKNAPIIVGGPLATFSPEIIEDSSIDMICIGEGEEAIEELPAVIEDEAGQTKIKNLWVKKRRHIFKNSLRPTIDDLDEIEFPDRNLYDDYPFIRDDASARVIISRGCPYSCSFCFESAYRKIFGESGYKVRKRSVDNVIAELIRVKEKYRKRRIWFIDDLFPLHDKQWLSDLLQRYRKEVALPFRCHTRIDLIDEEIIWMLKDNGFCEGISFGLETGNETYRKEILRKKIDNDRIRKGVKILRHYGLKFSTTNMMGLPGEKVEDALLTIKFNRNIKPSFCVCTVYQPLPNTKLAEFALGHKYIEEEDLSRIPLFSHSGSLLRQKDIDLLVNLHKFFYLVFYVPSLTPLVKVLIKIPNNLFYNMFYKVSYFIFYMHKIYRFKWLRMMQEAAVSLTYYHDRW